MAVSGRRTGRAVFAYLGPEPVPLLPRWELFVRDGVLRDIGAAVIPCNWLQIMENSLDPVHVEWLHQHFFNYVQERLGRTEFKGKPVSHKKINFSEFEHGLIKTRMLEGESEDSEDWQVGHPVLFPEYSLERQHAAGRPFRSACRLMTATRCTFGTPAMCAPSAWAAGGDSAVSSSRARRRRYR